MSQVLTTQISTRGSLEWRFLMKLSGTVVVNRPSVDRADRKR